MRRASIWVLVLVLLPAACTRHPTAKPTARDRPVEIVMWQPYDSGAEHQALRALVDEWNQTHFTVRVTAHFYGDADLALPRVEAAIASGSYPDIAYLYGSSAARISTNPKTLVLNDLIGRSPGMVWGDFWPSARSAAVVDGKIVGIPALVDNLAVVYNRRLFQGAGLAPPSPDWTWADFRAAAKALTDRGRGRYGWAVPVRSGESTVWLWEAMLWEAGGDILSPDGRRAAFHSPAGVRALRSLQQIAADRSVYLDPTNATMQELFSDGKLAMLVTGPWDLEGFSAVDYGVQIMPSFGGQTRHETISGPDYWVLLDNGPARSQAAFEFTSWLTAPQQDMEYALATGHLPLRVSETRLGEFREYAAKTDGIATYVANQQRALRSRPTTPLYPKISAALEEAINAALLGKADPRAALDRAARQANAVLATGRRTP